MATYTYELQETAAPYGGRVPDDAWERVSRHTSARAAWHAYSRHERSMARACGSRDAWTHHHRIIRLRDGANVTWYIHNIAYMADELDIWGRVDTVDAKDL
jgi:hypothetical protein